MCPRQSIGSSTRRIEPSIPEPSQCLCSDGRREPSVPRPTTTSGVSQRHAFVPLYKVAVGSRPGRQSGVRKPRSARAAARSPGESCQHYDDGNSSSEHTRQPQENGVGSRRKRAHHPLRAAAPSTMERPGVQRSIPPEAVLERIDWEGCWRLGAKETTFAGDSGSATSPSNTSTRTGRAAARIRKSLGLRPGTRLGFPDPDEDVIPRPGR